MCHPFSCSNWILELDSHFPVVVWRVDLCGYGCLEVGVMSLSYPALDEP